MKEDMLEVSPPFNPIIEVGDSRTLFRAITTRTALWF